MVWHASQHLRCDLHAGESVEQLNISHHTAHWQSSVVAHFVVSGGHRFSLNRRCCNMPTHRNACNVGAHWRC